MHPVTLALLDHLPAPAAGASVLDVAYGTGEPVLTLLRRWPNLELLRPDQNVYGYENEPPDWVLLNVAFCIMPATQLPRPASGVLFTVTAVT